MSRTIHMFTERDYTRNSSSSNSMSVDVEASGDDWDFELHTNSSNGHNRTVVGTLTTETSSGSRHSSSSTGWVLLIHTASGTITISYDTSTSTNTGGSAVKLADDTFGTYLFQRDIDANGNGTSSWSGTQAKRTETSYDWIDTGTDDETHSDSVTTLDIDDDWTYSETEYHETSQTGGVPNDPYDFTTQDTYETTNETQRETAEDTPNPYNAANHLNGAMATASGAVNQHTNSNTTGFGNAGTGSGSVQASGSSTTGESVPETGTLPNGNTYEKYDDGNYWYYKEWDEGILVIEESGYHETGSINMPLSAGQNAATGAEETVEDGDEVRAQYALPPQPKANANKIAEAAKNVTPDTLKDSYHEKARVPADWRGKWVEGEPGNGVWQFDDTEYNRKRGLAGAKITFKDGHIAEGGFPEAAYPGRNAAKNRVNIDLAKSDYREAADAEMKERYGKNWERPEGYDWHHVGGKGSTTLELVDERYHRGTAHKDWGVEQRRAKAAGKKSTEQKPGSTKKGSFKAKGLAIGDAYLTAKEALQAAGIVQPTLEVTEYFDYTFVEADGSVYVVTNPSWFHFGAKHKKKYIAGPKEGTEVVITDEEAEAHRKAGNDKWGVVVPGGLFSWQRKPYFKPGTARKRLPMVEYDLFGRAYRFGYMDINGVHWEAPIDWSNPPGT